MPKKRKSQFLRALEERQAEARRERAREDGSANGAEANESRPAEPEDKVLLDRPPALWPAKKRRPQWK
jgi:hypothetical protein